MLLADLIDDYIEYSTGALSLKTLESYKTDLQQMADYFDQLPVDEIRTGDIERYKRHLVDNGYHRKSINRKMAAFRSFKAWVNNYPRLDITIFAEAKGFKIPKYDYLQNPLTLSEFNRMVSKAEEVGDKRAIALFHALYRTGGRISEVLQLKVKSIKGDFEQIVGKKEKLRDLFIDDRVKAHCWDYIAGRPDEEWLFMNEKNSNPMSRYMAHYVIKKYARLAKVNLKHAHAHNFRHLLGMQLADEGWSLADIAEILGHDSLESTRIYTRKTKDELRRRMTIRN